MQRDRSIVSTEASSTTELVRQAVAEAGELLRVNVALMRLDLEKDAKRMAGAATALAFAALAGSIALVMLGLALFLAIGGTAAAALAVSAVFLVLAGAAVAVTAAVFPKNPLATSRRRFESELEQLKEHLA